MSIICGTKKHGDCHEEVCFGLECPQYTEIFTGKDYELELLRNIADIYGEYSIRRIKSRCRKSGGLMFSMAVCGHGSQYVNDWYDLYYTAGTIVLLQQHQFHECSELSKYHAYKAMRKLHLYMDKRMKKDCKKTIQEYNEIWKKKCD